MTETVTFQSDKAQYRRLYRRVAGDGGKPLLHMSFKAEGAWDCSALLFVPAEAAYDLFDDGGSFGLQLYSHRRLVEEKCRAVLPRYLRFLKGVVGVNDLPLNASRQTPCDSHQLGQIQKWLTGKVLDTLMRLRTTEATKYRLFWERFGRVLKEGVSEDRQQSERVLRLLLFASSHQEGRLTTLDDYVGRMPPGQDHIFYLTGETRGVVERSPHLEGFLARGFEVLYLTDPVDEVVVATERAFKGHRFQSVAMGAADLLGHANGEHGEATEHDQDQLPSLMRYIEKQLKAHVRAVRISHRLTTSPACLVGEDFDHSPQLERLLRKGKGGGPRRRRILELNPAHVVVLAMMQRLRDEPSDPMLAACVELLWGSALLAEGSEIVEPVAFNSRLLTLMAQTLHVGPLAAA